LLFDRLKPKQRHLDAEGRGFQHGTLTIEQVEASVVEQLEWMLNTRGAWPAAVLEERARSQLRSTIDYGLPDLTVYPVGNADAMTRLARHLGEAIALYEPRIVAPQVVLEPADRSDALIVLVSGGLRFEDRRHPVRLRIPIRVERGAVHAR
jgi:type VI secretion system lysozyme-like protein